MNAQDAQNLGIADGDRVKVTSPYGSVEITATTANRFDCAQGYTFAAFFDDRVLINLIVEDLYDPISKESDFKKTCVKIEKA
jgi:nitrate reductase NapA